MKHTPGPWKFEVYENGKGQLSATILPKEVRYDHVRIAELPKQAVAGIQGSEIEANAALIASAPDMLNDLQMAEELIRDLNLSDEDCKLLGQIRRTIAKAEGR